MKRLYGSFSVLVALLALTIICFNVQASTQWVDDRKHAGDFPLATKKTLANILLAPDDFKVVHLAAHDLAADINRVTGRKPELLTSEKTDLKELKMPAVLVGTLGKNPLIDQLIADGKLDVSNLRGQWESFLIATVEEPSASGSPLLVIVGSDRRGTAFGIYELSQAIGVSPWYWWADVTPEKKSTLYVSAGTRRFGPPSVKYRGIFINDEGWGIHQWAAKNYEPENGGVGPKTYQKMFELMLRLKANTLWPAMHPVTKPFNHFPQNAQLADDYAIVMGSSHAEPMLRNNVGEWTAPQEHYNYLTHRDRVHGYWEERMRTNGRFENIYTMGMRGIHDSHIQGPDTDAERINLLQKVFAEQRALIGKHTDSPTEQVPQMFCAYKEVLGLYRQGLSVPDDVTIVWPDDNFGYMRNFANAEERKRTGGFGVYYHLSYLGAPMAYLWLNTTPPALIWQEMSKSYAMGADQIWIANVGDLKPAEIGTELFLQMAWDINRWQRDNQQDYLREWAAREFGKRHADTIAALMRDYYQLNYQRKPEHLQWWLPRAEPQASPLNEAESNTRLRAFTQLRLRTEQVRKKISDAKQDAFFQLVSYPINGSALANIRFLEGERGNSTAAHAADAQLKEETALWSTWLAQGKWKHFMALEPADDMWDKYRISAWAMPQQQQQFAKAKTYTDVNKKLNSKSLSFALEAENFNRKVDKPGAAWEIIPGLGRTGKGSVAVFPVTAPRFELEQLASKAPQLEYDVNFTKTGEFTLQVFLIPTHPLAGTSLRFAVALNDEVPRLVEFEVKDGSAEWAQGVLNATRIASTHITVTRTGKQVLKFYGVDAGVLLDKIVVDVDSIAPSYLGLPTMSSAL
jgi:hypothetical protein